MFTNIFSKKTNKILMNATKMINCMIWFFNSGHIFYANKKRRIPINDVEFTYID